MAWQGKVARTERHGDRLDIIIHYTDDEGQEYDQTISTTVAQADTWLSDQINTKLNQLNDLDVFQMQIQKDKVTESTVSVDTTTKEILLDGVPVQIDSVDISIPNP